MPTLFDTNSGDDDDALRESRVHSRLVPNLSLNSSCLTFAAPGQVSSTNEFASKFLLLSGNSVQ